MTLRVPSILAVMLVVGCGGSGGAADGGSDETGTDPTPGSSTPGSADTSADASGTDGSVTDTADTSDTADTADTATTGEMPTCEATHTAADATLWTLPTPTANLQYEPFTQQGGGDLCSDDSVDFYYSTLDLTGDGALDLVVTSACDDGDVGTDFWLVYPGGASGFATEAKLWTLPTPTANLQYEPFTQLGGGDLCDDDSVDFYYSTTDLTGDRVPDLVVTSACDAGDVGTDFWLVYPGGADGFATEAKLWTLPTPTANLQYEPFTQLGGGDLCDDDSVDFYYSTLDLTGDGKRDLVVTSACDAGDVGTDFWLVYAGGDSGFASDATLWTLPTPTASLQYEPFTQLGGGDLCDDDSVDFYYSTLDLTGDHTPDLVVTSACDAGDVGTDFWLVYPGGDGGFASDASLWSLPDPTANLQYEPFTQLGGGDLCDDDSVDFYYSSIDLTDDGRLDLVVTSACDAGDVGTDFWLVYPGSDTGFADEAALWSLPQPTASLQYEPFTQLGGGDLCDDDSVDFYYSTTDLDGDGILDLVVTSACDTGDVGTDFWLMYPGACE